jgi:hypothetical protein
MAAGRYDCEFRAAVTAVSMLFLGEDDELPGNPYRVDRTGPDLTLSPELRQKQQDAVFDLTERFFAEGGVR